MHKKKNGNENGSLPKNDVPDVVEVLCFLAEGAESGASAVGFAPDWALFEAIMMLSHKDVAMNEFASNCTQKPSER